MLKSLEPNTGFLLATDQVFGGLACLLVVSAAHFSICELWDFVYYLKYLCFFCNEFIVCFHKQNWCQEVIVFATKIFDNLRF